MLTAILLAGSAYAEGGSRLDIHFIIHHKDTESAVTAEALIRENELLILSGLFPSYAFSLKGDYTEFLSGSDDHVLFPPFSIPETGNILKLVMPGMNTETFEGFFAGDLFDDATSVTKCVFSWNDILSDAMSFASQEGLQPDPSDGSMADGILSVSGLQKLSGIQIRSGIYDDGKYLVLNAVNKDRTFATISCDFSDPSGIRSVLGYAENGKNFFWVHNLSIVSSDEIKFSSALLADPRKQGYRSAMINTPVVTESGNIQLSENRSKLTFSCQILPGNKKRPIGISGYLSFESRPVFNATISFMDWEDAYFTLSFNRDDTTVNTESLKIISMDKFYDLTDSEALLSEVSLNMVQFVLDLIQAVPEEYREDLTALF